MIITRTPVRVSFFGGGTDYPAYYRRYGGATLATTIDKYIYVTVQHLTEYFEHNIQVHYSKVESVENIDELVIPNVREALRFLNIHHGVEVHLVSDLPARTGLGTSSSTTVGLLKALHGHQGAIFSNQQLAEQAIHIEQKMIGERVGSQDQYSCAIGGLLHLQFQKDGAIHYEPITIGSERLRELESHLILMYTGVRRSAHEVLDEQLKRTNEGILDDSLAAMRNQVGQAIDILAGSDSILQFGELLHEAWQLKHGLSEKISNPLIDEAYRQARQAGAIGGKLLGAGGGGFLLLFVEPERQADVKKAVSNLSEVQFGLEAQGARVIYYDS